MCWPRGCTLAAICDRVGGTTGTSDSRLCTAGQGPYRPIVARTRTVHTLLGAVAYDCVKLIVVRSGSAILFSEFGEKPVNVGDVVLLGPNTLCGSEPEDWITTTTLYLDTDYVVDQVFWQHASILGSSDSSVVGPAGAGAGGGQEDA